MLAISIQGITSSSAPIFHAPKLSPISQLSVIIRFVTNNVVLVALFLIKLQELCPINSDPIHCLRNYPSLTYTFCHNKILINEIIDFPYIRIAKVATLSIHCMKGEALEAASTYRTYCSAESFWLVKDSMENKNVMSIRCIVQTVEGQ
ncbi:hypothetical protein VAEKB19_5030008 [Vibrio aestuarianus]|nr:hypothetical protein VAEKB19_5030008 [Vibrio aestuarianus]